MKRYFWKRACAALLVGLLLLTVGCAAQKGQYHNDKPITLTQSTGLTPSYRQPQAVPNATNKMRHAASSDGYVPPPPTPSVTPSTGAASVAARQAFVYDYSRGLLFAQGGMTDALYPASTTKLVTALVVLEHLSPDTVCTAGDELSLVAYNSSSAYLQKGRSYTVAQLLAGMLLPSGCDASYTLAAHVGRKLDPSATGATAAVNAFLTEMNAWAARNGMTHSHFKNPDGYHASGHYSCMQDLLTLSILCRRNATVMDIVGKTSISGWSNSNQLLYANSSHYNASCIGLKTGTTGPAGNCLLSAFEVDGRTVIIGVFGAGTSNTRYTVTNYLFRTYIKG